MAAGGMGSSNKLFLTVDLDILGDEKLGQLSKMLNGVGVSSRNAEQGMTSMQTSTDAAADSSKEATGQFGKMFGIGMNLMFLGMALQQVFGKLAGSMMKTTGASAAFGAAAKSTLLPFFIAITPLLIKIAMLFTKLPKPVKMALGAFVALMAVLGTFLFFGAQIALLAISLQVSLLALASAILTGVAALLAIMVVAASVVYVFQRFGKVAGAAAGIIGGALLVAFLEMIGATNLLALGFYNLTGSTTTLTISMYGLNMSMTSLALMAGTLALSILLLNRVFKKFGPIVGALATIIGAGLLSALSPVAAIGLAIFGAFKAVNKVFKKFGNIAGVVATGVVGAIAVLAAPIIGLPAAILIALAAVIAMFWNLKDEIWSALKAVGRTLGGWATGAIDAIQGFVKGAKNTLTNLPQIIKSAVDTGVEKLKTLLDFFINLPVKIAGQLSNINSAMIEIGKEMVNGVVDGIKSIAGNIKDAFFNALPPGLKQAVKGVSKFSSGLLNNIQGVLTPNDFILTSDGKMIQPHADDTLIGTKNPENLGGGGGGGNVTVNINDPVMKEDVDVKRVVDEVEERVDRNTRGRSNRSGM